MIISRPKTKVLFSLGVFWLACTALTIYFLVDISSIDKLGNYPIYKYILLGLAAVASLGLLFRITTSYKVITVGKGKVNVNYVFLFKKVSFDTKQMTGMSFDKVKTTNGVYEQINVKFENGGFHISKQEYENFGRIKKYLQERVPKHLKQKK